MASKSTLPASFRRMREAGELIDIILVFGNKEVPCHKVILAGTCEYFKKIFLTSSNVSTRIPITGVNAQTGIVIVDYLYSGYIDITTDNAKDLLQASKLFSLVGLIQIIETMLCDKLCPENAISQLNLSRVIRMEKLIKCAYKCIIDNFDVVLDKGELSHLRKDDLVQLITSHGSHENRFLMLQKWSHTVKERSTNFMELLKHIKLNQCSKEFITSTVMGENLMGSPRGLELIQLAMQWSETLVIGYIDGSMRFCSDGVTWEEMQKPSDCYQRACATPNGFFLSGGNSSTDNCYSYDSRKKAWTTLPPMIVTRQQHGSTHHQGAILIAGGTDGNGNGLYCKSVERFDLGTNQWSILPPLPHGVLVPSVVSLSNRLFVLGGHLGKSYSGAIYEFDFKRNVWLARASMPDESWCASAVAFDEYVYVINGFSYKNLRYDIHQDSWEEIQAPMFDHCVSPAVVWKGKIHTLGGHKEEEKNTMEVLDPQTQQWSISPLTLPTKHDLYFAVVI